MSTQLPGDVFSGLLEATGKHTVNWLYCHLAFLNSSISQPKATVSFECFSIDLKLFARNVAIKPMCFIAFDICHELFTVKL